MHWMIAARFGDEQFLDQIKQGFLCGAVAKIDYEKSLRLYQKYGHEVNSDQRDRARDIHWSGLDRVERS